MSTIFKKDIYEFKYVANAYRSNGYIYLVWTGPRSRALCTRWMGRCSITSKNAREKIFSILLVITTILLSIRARFSSFNVVAHKSLKNKLISAIDFHMFSGKPIKVIESNYSMKTWQSWIFILCKIPCAISTLFPKFEAYPSGFFKL